MRNIYESGIALTVAGANARHWHWWCVNQGGDMRARIMRRNNRLAMRHDKRRQKAAARVARYAEEQRIARLASDAHCNQCGVLCGADVCFDCRREHNDAVLGVVAMLAVHIAVLMCVLQGGAS